MVAYEPTITLGNVIHILMTAAACAGIYTKVAERITRVETKLENMREGYKEDLENRVISIIYKANLRGSGGTTRRIRGDD